MSKSNKSHESVFTMPIAELTTRIEQAKEALAELEHLLPGLVTMTEADRRHSDGKMRDGEAQALGVLITAADASPQYFTALADKDGGVDPTAFETGLLRDHLARRDLLASLTGALETFTTAVDDTVLAFGEHVRPVLLAAYQIAKSVAAADDTMRAQIAPALDFYGRIGRRGAETRAKKPPAS